MTPTDIISAALPGANEEVLDFVLWNRTPFPFDANPKMLFKRAAGYRRACKNGIDLCELCTRPARPEKWTCEKCDAALKAARRGQK